MPQGIPINPTVRAAILTDLKAGGNTCRGLARKHSVSDATVRKIANDENVVNAFSRVNTEKATRARVADMATERADISELFLRRAREALEQMVESHLVYNFGGKENSYAEHVLERPPTGDLRNLMVTAATAIDKHMAVHRFNTGTDAEQVGGLLGALFDSFRERRGDPPAE